MATRKQKPKRSSTLAQAAVALAIDRATLARWCRSGAPHDRVETPMGRMVLMLVDVEEVRAWRATKPNGNTGAGFLVRGAP